jgi:hypothetical protein
VYLGEEGGPLVDVDSSEVAHVCVSAVLGVRAVFVVL